jgi:hypothetical protein
MVYCRCRLLIFISIFSLTGKWGFSQGIDQEKLIRMRDSLDNLLIVNPTTSAILVRHHEIEIFSFNSLLTNSQLNDKQGNSTNFDGKQILFSSIFQFNYGISKNRRLNLGIDLNYRAYRYDPTGESSAASVFKSDPLNTSAFTYAGLRIRWQPFKRIYNFTYQSNLWFPTANKDTQVALGSTKVNWGHTFFYYKYLTDKIGLFSQASVTLAFPGSATGEAEKAELYIPISLSLSYVANRKNIFFGSLAYSWITTDISKIMEGGDNDFSQFGIGYQHIFSRNFFTSINYSGTMYSRNYGTWNGLNVGIRYLY